MKTLFRETQRWERNAQARNDNAETVKYRHTDATQPLFLLFVIFPVTLLTHIIQHAQQFIRTGNGAVGAAFVLHPVKDLLHLFAIAPGQQYFTNCGAVERVTTTDA